MDAETTMETQIKTVEFERPDMLSEAQSKRDTNQRNHCDQCEHGLSKDVGNKIELGNCKQS